MSTAWPSGRRARSPRDMTAAWCSSTPVASGSDPPRWRSRRALCHERGLRAGGPDRRGIWRASGGGGGVVLFDARGERLRPAPLEVKEGYVSSVAFGPEGRIAAGYGDVGAAAAWCSSTPVASGSDPPRWRSRRAMSGAWPSGRRAGSPRDMATVPRAGGVMPRDRLAAVIWRRRRGALRRPWRAAPTRPAGGQGGQCLERGLRAGGPDRRGIWAASAAAAAAWCSSTPVASGSDPRRWRSRRARSRAWPSGRRAGSPRDIATSAAAAAAWCSSTPVASGSDPRRWRSRRAVS